MEEANYGTPLHELVDGRGGVFLEKDWPSLLKDWKVQNRSISHYDPYMFKIVKLSVNFNENVRVLVAGQVLETAKIGKLALSSMKA